MRKLLKSQGARTSARPSYNKQCAARRDAEHRLLRKLVPFFESASAWCIAPFTPLADDRDRDALRFR